MKKSKAPTAWETDEDAFPTQHGRCRHCNRSGYVKLAWDSRGYLCIHAGKCLARATRTDDTEE